MRSSLGFIGVLIVAATGLVQCLGPTEIEVALSTDVPCSSVLSTAVAVGPPGDDSRSAARTTTDCSADGGIGTLYVTPSGGIDDEIEIRATLGLSTPADQCGQPNFDGCVVARRQLRFTPHTRLVVPIELDQSCLDHPCDPNSTCVDGACVDAGVPPCANDICTLGDGGAPDAAPPPDGGPCTPLGPLPVASVAFEPPIHLLRLPAGQFAVAWENAPSSGARDLVVATIDAAGNVGSKLSLGTVTSSSDSFSDVGTDGANFAAAENVGGTLFALLLPVQGGTPTTTKASVSVAMLSRRGFLRTAAEQFAFVGNDTSGAGLDVIGWTLSTSAFASVQRDTVDPGYFADLTTSNGLTFISYAKPDDTCTLITCTGAFPSGSCTPESIGGCASVHAGATASQSVILGTRNPSGYAAAYKDGTTGNIPLLGFAAGDVLVVPAAGDDVRAVWATGQELDTVLVTSAGNAIGAPTTAIPANSIALDDFDAIGTPASDEWATAYYDPTTTQIFFARFCQ